MDSVLSSSSVASEISSTSPQAGSPDGSPSLVVLVAYPDDWRPSDVKAVPPTVEVQAFDDDAPAAAFARLFNEREIQQPSGRWAIDLANASVVIVGSLPADWKPIAATDLPPNIEVHKQSTAYLSGLFADNFNRLELETASSGHWAVAARSTSDRGLRVEGDSFDVIDEHSDDDSGREGRDDFDRMFPGLPVVVIGTDGSESTEYVHDPRAAYARSRSRHEGVATVRNGDDHRRIEPTTTVRRVDPSALTPPAGNSDPGLMRLAAMGSVPQR